VSTLGYSRSVDALLSTEIPPIRDPVPPKMLRLVGGT
jgi:hypothetical protein